MQATVQQGSRPSVTTTPLRVPMLFDWLQVPAGLSAHKMLRLMDKLLDLGPCGFRGPAAICIPSHLTFMDGGVRTVQIIAPGNASRSNRFLARAMDLCGQDLLNITSAHRMSTTIVSFHRLAPSVAEGRRPCLVVDRHGSLPVAEVRAVAERLGFDLVLSRRRSRRWARSAADGGVWSPARRHTQS